MLRPLTQLAPLLSVAFVAASSQATAGVSQPMPAPRQLVAENLIDVAGNPLRTLVNEDRAVGRYTETWTGLDVGGARVASGVYFYRLDAPHLSATRKMVLLQ